jgi:hypothetical protein
MRYENGRYWYFSKHIRMPEVAHSMRIVLFLKELKEQGRAKR